jgi:hypothetical protein
MSGAAIEQLLTDVCSELAGCGSYAAAMRERLMAEIKAALDAAPVTVTDDGTIVRTAPDVPSAIDQPIPYTLADKPLWTDASTYAYHARLCLVCGHETSHWTEQSPAAEQMEQHLATHLAAAEHARCCMCGSIEVRYRNYREQPFCWPCADGTSPEAKVQLAAALEAMNG